MVDGTPASEFGVTTTRGSSFWTVIPAGGSGSRLWPVSRSAHPKFLLPLLSDESLLQQTVARLAPLAPPERTLIVCGPAHAEPIKRQLPALSDESLVVEPAPRGSGAAIGLATAVVCRRDPDALIGSFAADHEVRDAAAFAAAARVAIEAANAGWLVTIGLTPTRPETGYGYIEATDDKIVATGDGAAYRAARFVEKPDLARATAYVESGRFLWNASMFIWRARAFLDELARLQPALHAGLMRVAAAWDSSDRERVLADFWPTLPETTVDQGVMEHAARVAVVPAAMGWSDVGDWHGLGELLDRDLDDLSIRADLVHTRARSSVVWSETKRVIALVGLENVVVVDTPD
ncbi:MAG TPA: mannose-1-phosphate guanylyltransferase, partial [Thermomicrobiales bacterium]|nr:mannose-1-phosphate guanylyltransferase [Thermomicrobiales bacterium]